MWCSHTSVVEGVHHQVELLEEVHVELRAVNIAFLVTIQPANANYDKENKEKHQRITLQIVPDVAMAIRNNAQK